MQKLMDDPLTSFHKNHIEKVLKSAIRLFGSFLIACFCGFIFY
jgi:hypothetical protein